MRGLYPIVDVDLLTACHMNVLDFALEVLTIRPALMQLRAKHVGAGRTLALLQELREPCRQAQTLLFANDRPDLALIAGCDGVHVGQGDLPVPQVRRIAPDLKIGVSTHSVTQLDGALELAPDYVAFGPVFPTQSKEGPDPVVGLEGLAGATTMARRAGIPLVAIGGIDSSRAAAVGELGALGAVISALLPGEGLRGVAARARLLHRQLGGRTTEDCT